MPAKAQVLVQRQTTIAHNKTPVKARDGFRWQRQTVNRDPASSKVLNNKQANKLLINRVK